MLVLTRKAGQRIVLPEQGITIDILQVNGARVRVGVSAPADVPIHRSEVWARRDDADQATHQYGDDRPNRLSQETKGPTDPALGLADLDHCLQCITKRTGRRINRLSIEMLDGRMVISGCARSYYVRQLAQAAINEVVGCRGLSPDSVECNIDVSQFYWRSDGCTHALTRLNGVQQ
jgi:carbon storage regulator